MIDTIVLLIPLSQVQFFEDGQKGNPKWDLQASTNQYKKFVRNPSKKNKDTGLYFPRITQYERDYGRLSNLRIEFSVPKLIFDNNLQELTDVDFERVVSTLQDRLKQMGVFVLKKILQNANVSSVHYSRNIVFTSGVTSQYVISQLAKIDLSKSFDFARARYINDGQSLCAHTRSHELVIYDKIADLKKPKKRAIDRDPTLYQASLFSEFKKQASPTEILRIEVRLAQKQKLKGVLKKVEFKSRITFKNLFDESLSKRIIQFYWENVIKKDSLGLFTIETSPKVMFQNLYLSEEGLRAKEAIYLIGLNILAKDNNGLRELRRIIESKQDPRTWHRIKKDFRECQDFTKNPLRDWFVELERYLKTYTPLRELPCKEK